MREEDAGGGILGRGVFPVQGKNRERNRGIETKRIFRKRCNVPVQERAAYLGRWTRSTLGKMRNLHQKMLIQPINPIS